MADLLKFQKIFLGVTSLTVAGTAAAAEKPAEKPARPNILFIAIDDMKPCISPYGDPVARTPAFERIAARGVTFTSAYCQQALSGPSRASLLTGLRPDHTGVWSLQGNFRRNNPDIVTLPECLMENGYETVSVGKIFHPLNNKKYKNDPASWSRPYIKTSAPTYQLANGRVATECADVPDNAYVDGVIADEAIDAMSALKGGDKPFFLAVGFHKPHLPYCAPKRYWDLYDRERMPLAEFQQMSSDPVEYAYHPSNELKVYTDIPSFHSYVDTQHLDEQTQRRVIHAYYACVSYIDAQVGRVLDALERNGLADNTIIVLWGDHGYHLGDHGLWNKLTNFEQATRVCMMIAAPGMKQGVRSASLAEFLDIYPTLCQLAGCPAPENLDGVSLVPVLKNPKARVKEYAVSQYHRKEVQGYAIRDSRYRYVEWVGDFKTYMPFDGHEVVGRELYDYDNDPLERVNLADDPRYAKVVRKLSGELHAFYDRQYRSPMSAPIAAAMQAKGK